MIPTLHDFQMDLFNRVRAARVNGARIIVVQGATGSGKNTVAAYFAMRTVEKEKKVFMLAHRRKLVDQISQRLNQFEVPHGVIMRGDAPFTCAPVQVASRDTILSRCFTHDWINLPAADLVIVDEAHHCADPKSEYRRILHQYPKATILLLSATPTGPDGTGLGPWAQAIECALPTSQLIQQGYLCPVKVYAPDRTVNKGKVSKRGIAGDMVESNRQYSEGMPTVLFLSRVEHSKEAVTAFNAEGIPAAHVDADTPEDVRDRIFDQLARGQIKVVSNVGIIGEGIDIPQLGCCQLYCEAGGRVKFLQAVGRIMRTHPGKTHGVLIDHSGAVFRHGFPDEDTDWPLIGNANVNFVDRRNHGLSEEVRYCKHCEILYHTTLHCPQCGRVPAKPPKSTFDAQPIQNTNEILTEADRNQRPEWTREVKLKIWYASLQRAKTVDGSYAMASVIYMGKIGEWPDPGFPFIAAEHQRKEKVRTLFPNFGKKKAST